MARRPGAHVVIRQPAEGYYIPEVTADFRIFWPKAIPLDQVLPVLEQAAAQLIEEVKQQHGA